MTNSDPRFSAATVALKPCPFCGKPPVMIASTEDDSFIRCYEIRCDQCGIEVSEEYKGETIERWNTRASTSHDAQPTLRCPACASANVSRNPNGWFDCRYCNKMGSEEEFASQPSPAATVETAEVMPANLRSVVDALQGRFFECGGHMREMSEREAFDIALALRRASTKSAPTFQAPQNNAERLPSSDAAEVGADTQCSADTGGVYGAKLLPPGVSIASANKAIEFLEWLSGYIGHGPAVQINSEQMEYIRSKVHPLVHELDGRAPTEPQPTTGNGDAPK